MQRIRRQRLEHPAHVQADEYPDARPIADANSDGASNAHADATSDADPHAPSNSKPDALAEPDADAVTDAESHPHTGTDYV